MYYRLLSALSVGVMLLLSPVITSVAGSPEQALLDTRVLIDISGSMKQNDPAYLRRPALRLLVELLPAESRAGIWTFGQYVNMQVPLGTVDEAWREKARKGAAEIHSRGQFTDIEEALRRSTADWEEHSSQGIRHLILLTDGMVDVSKQATESAASRDRIASELLSRLQKYGVRVHTIALSERADHQLMRLLSVETDGWYEQVDSADKLQRVFMRLFEKVGRPDAVPLVDNRFQLDESIDEATLLIFRADGAPPSQVTDPTGQTFGSAEAPANVNWHRDEGYDLLTISKPQSGEWQILADLDPDNRVLVVTDLRMHSTELPGRMVVGEQLPLLVHFSEDGEPITSSSFLELINLQAVEKDRQGTKEPQPLFDDGQRGDQTAGDGQFTLGVGANQLEPGLVELTLSAEGRTFQRQQKQTFELLPWFDWDTDYGDGQDGAVKINLRIENQLLQPDSFRLAAELIPEGRTSEVRPVTPTVDGQEWQVVVDPSALTGDWRLHLHLIAVALSGSPLDVKLDPVSIQGRRLPPPPPPSPLEAEVKPAVPSTDAPDESWVDMALVFGGVNLLVLIAASLTFWLLRRKLKNEVALIGTGLKIEESKSD
ncbi:MAG: VWA domain-containing protein [Gammaproteobacteria bacterium]|nr:VWA domain-containing protein [Gammaproteobacteria bacterium]